MPGVVAVWWMGVCDVPGVVAVWWMGVTCEVLLQWQVFLTGGLSLMQG